MEKNTNSSPLPTHPAEKVVKKVIRSYWWQVLLLLTTLAIAVYREKPFWHYVKAEATITEVTTSTSRNRTVQGCVVSYRYCVEYRDTKGQIHFAQHEHSTESRTCRTDEIKRGDRKSVHYNPENPAKSVQYTSDAISAGLYLLAIFGIINLLVQWLVSWWGRR